MDSPLDKEVSMRHLARVQPATPQGRVRGADLTRFCTHCASLYDLGSHRARVCPDCGLGVILTCASTTLTTAGAAFLVVTSDLRVSAASQHAEDIFDLPDGTYGRPLMALLTSPVGVGELARLVVRAANGTYAPATIAVEPTSSKVGASEFEARIGGCGNPPAALVVVEVTAA
jgi:hypothetical protein